MKIPNQTEVVRPAGVRWLAAFQKFARQTARSSGHPLAFALALGLVLLWAVTGPLFNSGNTWLLIINTITNIVTFLMIFLIRNAQNRESEAVQLKLDELIRATTTAQNSLLDIEELSEEELDRIKARFERLARKARETSTAGHTNFLQHQDDRRPVPPGPPSNPPLP
jgi:low affinity Fe/Cu permease